MKNRILGMVLIAALMLGLVAFQPVTAEAASEFQVSPEMVEMIKKWEGFCFKPVWDYGQWTVGYGTRAPAEHLDRYRAEGISKEEAESLLVMYVNNMGKSVNSFIDKYGLKVNQAQFDAMLSFTYNVGGGWMFQASTLRNAVVEGWTGSDFVFALGEWSNAGGVILPGLVRRRLCEAEIYLNGVYDINVSSNLSYVIFNGNGGKSDVSVQCYVIDENPEIRAVATYDDYTFQGWYTDPSGGEKVEKLDAGVQGYTLYAHWGAGEGVDQPQDTPEVVITGTPVSYVREVAAERLNAFKQPVKGALVVDSFYQYDLLEITAEYTDNSGVKWGQVKNVGWVNLEFTQEPTEDDEEDGVTVRVTGTDVNLRRGPGTAYARVGSANIGDELVITRTTTAGGYTWGKSSKGWIALKYTNYDDVINGTVEDNTGNGDNSGNDDQTGSGEATEPTTPNTGNTGSGQTGNTEQKDTVMGTVKVSDFLYIRAGAGTSNPVVGYLTGGTRVEILEKKANGGTIWGRIEQGWISLTYVVLDKTESDSDKDNDSVPQEPAVKPEEPKVTGKVKLNSGRLNIRTGPSTGYAAVGSYGNGDAVTILEQQTVGNTVWGKTDKGWISMDYVVLDKAESEPDNTPPETKPEENVPEVTEPEETEPEVTEPEETEPEETVPEVTVPETKPEDNNKVPVSSVTGTVTLNSGALTIRSGAGTHNSVLGYLYNGAKVTILEQQTVTGTVWGRIDKGWISMKYVRLDNTQTAVGKTGTINSEGYLWARSGPGTGYSVSGSYYRGDKVLITEVQENTGTLWGKTEKGWVSLKYVSFDTSAPDTPAPENPAPENPTPKPDGNQQEQQGVAGTVTGSDLRIRSGAGTNYTIVGVLQKGDQVTILETKEVGGMTWGKISRGWICMDYVKTN